MIDEKPKENEGMAASPDYDTLNFARQEDPFAAGAGAGDDNKQNGMKWMF